MENQLQLTKTREQEKSGIRRWCRRNRVCLWSFGLALAMWMVIAMFMEYAPFGDNSFLTNDAVQQYYPFLMQYRERLLGGGSLLYSMGGGLGFNFLSLWSYYLTSPLNVLTILFPPSHLDLAMNLFIILKLSLGSLGLSFYLVKRCGRQDMRIIPFACAYSLSSFVIGYAFNIMWLDSVALFPVIAASLEELVKKGRWKLYTAALALSLWCSFYISFMICIFLVIWFLFQKFDGLKQFIKRGFLFAGSSLLAAGISCLVLLPAYIGISQTLTGETMPSGEMMASFADIFAGKEGGIFIFSDPVSVINTGSFNANLYCGIFALVLAVFFFFSRSIQVDLKIKWALLLGFLVLSMNHSALNYIWHGFHNQVGIPNRFTFLAVFLVLLMGYESFTRISEYKLWQILVPGITLLGGIICLYCLRSKNVKVSMLVCTIVLAVGYTAGLIWLRKKEGDRRLVTGILLTVMCAELLTNGIVGSRYQSGIRVHEFYRSQSDVYQAARELPQDGYRTELSNPTVVNEGMAYNLCGLGIFGSMVNARMATLLGNLGFFSSSNQFNYTGGTPVINTLFGLKNMLIIAPDANRLDYRYEKTGEKGKVSLYENDQVLPAAYMVHKDAADWSTLDKDYFHNQMELLRLMTGKEYEIFTEQKYELTEANDVTVQTLDGNQHYGYLQARGEREDHLVFEAAAPEDEDLYFRIRAKYSEKVQVLVNDKLITYKELKDDFYHVGNLKKGDVVTLKIGIGEDSETYGKISLSMYAYHQDKMDEAFEELNAGSLQMESFQEGNFRGTVRATADKNMLFTTIPAEKGWEAYVDGKAADIHTVKDSFIYLELEEGEHEIEFRYTPPGLNIGLGISLVSLLIFILACLAGKRFGEKTRKTRKGEMSENEAEEKTAVE